MAIKKIEHVGIKVQDIDVSIKFYRDVLGLELLDILKHSATVTLAFMGFQGQDVVIELIEGSTSQLEDKGRVSHLAFTVDDLEAEIKRLNEFNVTFKSDEISILPNGSRYIFFDGPDKESLELFQPNKH